MRELRPEQLQQQLQRQSLTPLYLLAGMEALPILEAADAVRAKAREVGFTERDVLHVEPGFDWRQLADTANSLSLFAERRIIELHLPEKGPGREGGKALTEYIRHMNPDTLLLVIAAPINSSVRKNAWYKKLGGAGTAVFAWPIDRGRLPDWIRRRAAGKGLQPDAQACELLADLTEGNLLACAQEIDRLALLHGPGPLSVAEVTAATGDHARFGIFDLPAKALDGDPVGALRSLRRLWDEDIEDVPILWALVREIRLLYRATLAARAGRLDAMLKKIFMPPQSKRQLARAARRSDPLMLAELLQHAARADRIFKGAQPGRGRDELVTLTLGLAGVAPHRPATNPDEHHL